MSFMLFDIVIATSEFTNPFLWYGVLFLFTLLDIFLVVMLTKFSHSPEDWKHDPRIEGEYQPGQLSYLAESIRQTPSAFKENTPIRKMLQSIFFEKIQSIRGTSSEDLRSLKINDEIIFRTIVKDKGILDWMYNEKKKETGNKHIFFKKRKQKKDFFSEINTIIDKMEAWGK
jgi:hypothetical protein